MNETAQTTPPTRRAAEGAENSEAQRRRVASWKRVTPVAGAFAVLVGASVLLGWAFDLPLLKSVLPRLPVMVPNTALCLVLSGIALGLIGNERKRPLLRRIGQGSALILTFVGLLTLIEYASHQSLGLDLLLVRSVSAFPGNVFPGRPSLPTAMNLCLFGGALLLLSRAAKPGYRVAQLLAILAALISLMTLIGYLFTPFFLYGAFTPKWMAVHTGLACLALSLGILCAYPDQAIMAVASSDSAGGIMVRRLLPAVTLLPLLLGGLRYLGERQGLYDAATGVALMVLVMITLLVSLLLANAARLHSLDVRRHEAMDALAKANETLEARVRERTTDLNAQREWLRVTLTSIGDAVIATDIGGQIALMNSVAETLTGWKEAEALGKDLKEVFVIVNEETRQEVESPVAKVLREGVVVGLANHTLLLSREGEATPIDDTAAPIRDAEDNLSGIVLVFHDIRERKRAEEALRESEVLYRTLGEAVPDFVWACKANGESLYVNRRYVEYTGLSPDQPSDVPMNVLHHPDDYPHLAEIWKAARLRGEAYEAEFRLRRHDGVYRWCIARAVPVKDEQGDIVQWIGTTTDIHERKQAEQALRESEEQFRATFEQAAVGIAQIGGDFRWARVNQKLCETLGYTHKELLECTIEDICHPDDLNIDAAYVRQMLAGDIASYSIQKRNIRKDRSEVWVNLTVSLVRQPSGEPKYFICVLEDLTERKRLENQLLQAQKLESVGRLAGGVAHDFNNLLTAILGYAELAQTECTLDDTAQEYLANIQHAAERAATLTRQLLAFARRQVIEPKILDLNDLILSLDKMLRRLIGENIELVLLPQEDLHTAKADPGQLEQILVNLVVNARDALPDGGKITIETDNVNLDAEYARHHEDVAPGEYVLLVVSDTGTGMEEGIRLHIFEPFFTTKEKGRGTGLGLATVYGIVKQAGGHIWLYSEPGEGTTFKIYLPRTREAAESAVVPAPSVGLVGGSETILLVEDEPSVRMLAVQTLRRQGYRVLEAANGEEALRVVQGREQEIALLMTDVVMPRMSGKELAEALQVLCPGLKVLYASGYTRNTIVHHGVLEPGIAFLSKPFTPALLAQRVREILDNVEGHSEARPMTPPRLPT